MRINQDYKYRRIAGQHYLIPTGAALERHAEPLQLSETGAWIWEAMQEGLSGSEIAARMTGAFEVDAETAGPAVARFMEALAEQGMAESDPDINGQKIAQKSP